MSVDGCKPVILLAFANEQEGHHYLRNLPEELRLLRETLRRESAAGGSGSSCSQMPRSMRSRKPFVTTETAWRSFTTAVTRGPTDCCLNPQQASAVRSTPRGWRGCWGSSRD